MKSFGSILVGSLLMLALRLSGAALGLAPSPEESKADQATKLYQEGQALEKKGDYTGALRQYEASRKLAEEIGDKKKVARSSHAIGSIQRRQGRYPEALENYERALQIGEAEQDKKRMSAEWNSIGAVHYEQSHYAQAIEYYKKALKASEAVDDAKQMASTLNNLGVVCIDQGSYEEAVEYLQNSLKVRERLEDKPEMAATLNNIGIIYSLQGSHKEAIEYYKRALKIEEERGNKHLMANILNNIGNVYSLEGLYGEALNYFKDALKIREKLDDKKGMAASLNNLGVVYRAQGSYQEAAEYYKSALEIRQEVGDPYGIANGLFNISGIYRNQGLHGEALEYAQKSLKISQAIKAKPLTGQNFNHIARIYLEQQKYLPAREAAQQALAVGEEIKEPSLIQQAGHTLANTYERLGDLPQALSYYQLAVTQIEKVRAQSSSDEGKAGFFAQHLLVYEELIQLLYKLEAAYPAQGYTRQAFEYAERAKARTFLDLLEESRVGINIKEGIAADLLRRERALQAQLSRGQVRLTNEQTKPQPDAQRISQLERARDETYRQYDNLKNEIRQRHPRYAELKYPEPVTIERVQSLLDERTVLLEYLIAKEASFLFVATRREYTMYRLAAGRATLEELIREKEEARTGAKVKWFTREELTRLGVRQALVNPPDHTLPAHRRQPAYYGDHYLLRARQLYDLLIQPAARELAGKSHRIIVPDGMLAYLPFEVLLKEETSRRKGERIDFSRLPYLIRDGAIHYVSSASVWAELTRPESRPEKPSKELLAFGDPRYARAGPGARAAAREAPVVRACGTQFAPLNHSREEVQRLARLYPKGSARLYIGAEAQKANLKKEKLDQYRRIHLAVHGCLNEQQPQFSALVLSPDPSGREEGYLRLYEVFNLKLNAELVVLSACVTGLGQVVRGEGLIGLSRGFFYAGTPSVVASLWNVRDVTGPEFMEAFYRQLKEKDKAAALRSAKLTVIGSGIHGSKYFSHPSFWSAFVLLGERK